MRPILLLPAGLVDELERRRLARLPLETGGFLLGMRRGKHLEVTGVTDQAPMDVATMRSFERADRLHGKTAVAEWTSSGGLVSIVGDWHSHPRGPADFSPADKHAWRQLCRATGGTCVGIILGDQAVGIFLIRSGMLRLRISRLVQVDAIADGVAYADKE